MICGLPRAEDSMSIKFALSVGFGAACMYLSMAGDEGCPVNNGLSVKVNHLEKLTSSF